MDNAFKTIIVRIFFTFIPGNCLSYDYLDNDLLAIKEKVSLKKKHTHKRHKQVNRQFTLKFSLCDCRSILKE